MSTAATYWRRSAESVTAWLNRYSVDPFFRTEVNVLSLQIAFALVVLGLVGASFSLLYHDISDAIVRGIRAGLAANTPGVLGPSIVHEIQAVKSQTFLSITAVIILATILFGYIIARVTLAPARSALAAQKQFIGNVAHELRTPLSIIKTNTEVALFDKDITPDLRGTLESNVEELDRISEIINNLLSLSTLVKPERMEFSPVDLAMIAGEAMHKFSPLAKRGELQVTMRKSPDSIVWGNATALTQILSNILKNAITYTPRGGQVGITVEPAPNNEVVLRIRDSGIGIARKDLFRIFEPFYRADPSRTRGAAGSGLGLTIVSELVKMHRGRITMRSAVGQGTTVSVFFPGVAGRVVGHEADPKHAPNEIAVDFSKNG